MSTELKVPDFPESVTDGTILKWNRQPGEAIKRDESIVDVETDKVVFEVPAPHDGVLEEIVEQEGAVVLSGQVIGRIGEGQGKSVASEVKEEPAKQAVAADSDAFATPSARKLIEEHGLDPAAVQASGSGNRILKEDVLKAIEQKVKAPSQPAPVEAAAPVEAQPLSAERSEKRVPMTRLRARIAERLLDAQRNAAILTTFNEVNMQPVMELRARYRDNFEKTHGVKLGFMSFFVKAVIEALRRFPEINASVDDKEIVYHGYFDIGIAVSTPRGLVVPVLRDADGLSMAEIESSITAFAQKARDGKLSMEDITGGTFSITNGGVFGSLLSTPIINPPQSGILGMHKIQERPVAENGQVVVRPMMYVALSYDHRLVDGKGAVQFLVTLKEALEDPARMLLGV